MNRWYAIPSALVLVMVLCACSAPRLQNTRLDATDLVVMTDRMAESLLASPEIASRDGEAVPWIISVDRVMNLSSDVVPHRELWVFMGRLRGLLNQSDLAGRNITFVLSPEQAAALNQRNSDPTNQRATPTHALAATFHSLTLDDRSARSDTYVCVFNLIELTTDRVLWEDRYEVKRTVMRDEWD